MKILHILSQIPSFTGSGTYLQATMQHASRYGYTNYLLAGVPANFEFAAHCGSLPCLEPELIRFGQDIDLQIVGMSDVMPYPSAKFCELDADELLRYEACFDTRLQQAVARWQPDLIHAHHLWLLTSLARQRFPDIPLVASCHGSDLRQFHACGHLQPQVMRGCRNIDAVCALSLEQKHQIIDTYEIPSEKIHIVGAGYNSTLFQAAATNTSANVPANTPINIIYAGKLSRAKGVPWLIHALHQITDTEWHFHLVGEGSGAEKEEIVALSETLGTQATLHGSVTPEHLADLFKASHLFVLPSFYEGVPLVVLEALGCKCRVVTTNLPGIAEVFNTLKCDWIQRIELPKMESIDRPRSDAEAGFIHRLEQSIRLQMVSIRTQPSAQPPEAAQQILRKYEWGSTFSRIEKVYRQILA
ncbi:MAG: glycosyltransferase family 4 protein [Desulfuromonadaceae bacterium]|nr:glycosyltransferase family 4 protein [Desulfuromonas sp.]MDY0185244.1 glycosyltransferase family 4 protein [Desulfuromonadaceae bacterium]